MSIESDWLGDLAKHSRNPGGRPAKGHKGRQRKIHCERCGFIAYASASALERFGFPSCACGDPLVLANLRDRAIVEWDTLERDLMAQGRGVFDAAMRELGFTDMIESGGKYGHSGAVQHRCEVSGCNRFAGGRWCHEHEQHRPEVSPTYRRAA
jgi:hypothetical protein